MAQARPPLRSVIESTGGRPYQTSIAQAPSSGSISKSPLLSTQVFAVDFQTTSVAYSVTTTNNATLTFTATAFTGLLNPKVRLYSGKTTLPTQPASNTVPLPAAPEVQLILLTSVQGITGQGSLICGIPSIATTAIANQFNNNTQVGPFFPGGTTYTSFSFTATMNVYNPTAGTLTGTIVLGVGATLYGAFTN